LAVAAQLVLPVRPGHVLLKDTEVDRLIISKLQQAGGKLAFSSADGQIWIGQPVWNTGVRPMVWTGCKLSTTSGRATADCQIEKKDRAQAETLTFGPYVKLRPGTYAFELRYAGGGTPAQAAGKWDVAVQRGYGRKTLASGQLQGSQERPASVAGQFSVLPADANKALEVRTWGQAGATLRVAALEIRRVR
jgi:hypothetical protein